MPTSKPFTSHTRAIVDAHGRVMVEDGLFVPGQTVEVIALPASARPLPSGLVELFLRAAQPSQSYRWQDARVPVDPRAFEDLLFLFELSPLNRGLARLDVDEAAALFRAIASLEDPHGVEIGRFNGGSTFLLASAIGPRGRLDSIDVAPRDDEALAAALRQANLHERVTLVTADARGTDFGRVYDFAFIDGDHTYAAARDDHNQWGRRVRRSGLIVHHDMGRSRPFASQLGDLARLRADILRVQQDELEVVQEIGSLTMFRRVTDAWTDVDGDDGGCAA